MDIIRNNSAIQFLTSSAARFLYRSLSNNARVSRKSHATKCLSKCQTNSANRFPSKTADRFLYRLPDRWPGNSASRFLKKAAPRWLARYPGRYLSRPLDRCAAAVTVVAAVDSEVDSAEVVVVVTAVMEAGEKNNSK